jgi:hypothetical protein
MKRSPVFIVGMPRSGTKLLRGLLNNHSEISLLSIETEFLPFWANNWSSWGGGDTAWSYDTFQKFYGIVTKLPYFLYKKKHKQCIAPDIWYQSCESFLVSGVFEALARHDANAQEDMIWGDKSPGYIRHIPLIKQLFPDAKIIHIIRDVRDYCLSINKAWGKNMLRAAQRWTDDVAKARQDGMLLSQNYMELTYEALLEDPENILKRLCAFLDVLYDDNMLILQRPTENYGDAKDKTIIVSGNTGKWKHALDAKKLKLIEMICSNQLQQTGYSVTYKGNEKRIGSAHMKYLKLVDGFNLFKKGRGGKFATLKFHFRHAKTRIKN